MDATDDDDLHDRDERGREGEGYTGLRLDTAALKVLAHPLRSRLLSGLRGGGPATATELAARLRTNTGATSYHLRKLESVGLVRDTGEGEGKRRLWAAATTYHSWDASDFAGDEDAETALNWLVRDYMRQLGEKFERWLDVEGEWPPEWRDATGLSDTIIVATAAQAAEFKKELESLLERYRGIGEGDAGARRLSAYSILFPLDLDQDES